MEKLTLSIHDKNLKQEIKEYAKRKGLSVSYLGENYVKNLIKSAKKEEDSVELPADLENFLEGIDVDPGLRNKPYEDLRNEMYASR
jgi:hypothetical protein